MRSILACLISCFALSLHAKIFQNSYIQTDIPDDWICFQENTAHICRSPDERKGSEAIMIINARLRGPQDNMDEFRHMLQAKRTIYTLKNEPLQSTVYKTSDKQINTHSWLESTQFNSEIPNFYSYYYATVDDAWDAAILVNFNVSQKSAAQYRPVIDRIVAGLRFLEPSNQYREAMKSKKLASSPFASVGPASVDPTGETQTGRKFPWLLVILAGVALGAVAMVFQSRRA